MLFLDLENELATKTHKFSFTWQSLAGDYLQYSFPFARESCQKELERHSIDHIYLIDMNAYYVWKDDARITVAPKHMIPGEARARGSCMSKGRSISHEKIYQVEKRGSGGVVAGHRTRGTESIQM